MLHPCISEVFPSQGFPPYCAARKSRDLICMPPPQSWEQLLHWVHGIHAQSTGQCLWKHIRFSVCSPSHSLPLYWGTGLVQLRVLVCVPLSHVVLHSVHSVHSVQPPSTTINKTVNNSKVNGDFYSLMLHIHCVCCVFIVCILVCLHQ